MKQDGTASKSQSLPCTLALATQSPYHFRMRWTPALLLLCVLVHAAEP